MRLIYVFLVACIFFPCQVVASSKTDRDWLLHNKTLFENQAQLSVSEACDKLSETIVMQGKKYQQCMTIFAKQSGIKDDYLQHVNASYNYILVFSESNPQENIKINGLISQHLATQDQIKKNLRRYNITVPIILDCIKAVIEEIKILNLFIENNCQAKEIYPCLAALQQKDVHQLISILRVDINNARNQLLALSKGNLEQSLPGWSQKALPRKLPKNQMVKLDYFTSFEVGFSGEIDWQQIHCIPHQLNLALGLCYIEKASRLISGFAITHDPLIVHSILKPVKKKTILEQIYEQKITRLTDVKNSKELHVNTLIEETAAAVDHYFDSKSKLVEEILGYAGIPYSINKQLGYTLVVTDKTVDVQLGADSSIATKLTSSDINLIPAMQEFLAANPEGGADFLLALRDEVLQGAMTLEILWHLLPHITNLKQFKAPDDISLGEVVSKNKNAFKEFSECFRTSLLKFLHESKPHTFERLARKGGVKIGFDLLIRNFDQFISNDELKKNSTPILKFLEVVTYAMTSISRDVNFPALIDPHNEKVCCLVQPEQSTKPVFFVRRDIANYTTKLHTEEKAISDRTVTLFMKKVKDLTEKVTDLEKQLKFMSEELSDKNKNHADETSRIKKEYTKETKGLNAGNLKLKQKISELQETLSGLTKERNEIAVKLEELEESTEQEREAYSEMTKKMIEDNRVKKAKIKSLEMLNTTIYKEGKKALAEKKGMEVELNRQRKKAALFKKEMEDQAERLQDNETAHDLLTNDLAQLDKLKQQLAELEQQLQDVKKFENKVEDFSQTWKELYDIERQEKVDLQGKLELAEAKAAELDDIALIHMGRANAVEAYLLAVTKNPIEHISGVHMIEDETGEVFPLDWKQLIDAAKFAVKKGYRTKPQ